MVLAVDILGSAPGSQGLSILALIARTLVQLELTGERSTFLVPQLKPFQRSFKIFPPQPTCWIEDEEQRRLCWMLFVLDRYTAVESSLDFVIASNEIDRQLPCRYDLFSKNEPVETRRFCTNDQVTAGHNVTIVDKPENLGSFSYHCEVLRILSQIQDFLRKPIDINALADVRRWRSTYRDLDSELTAWLHHLPGEYGKISQLCHSDPGSRISNWIMLHAAFVTSVIRLHSAAAFPTSRSYIFTASATAVQRCLSAVESLREIAQDVVNGGMLDLLGPPFAFSLWVSARVLLVHAATGDGIVDSRISFFISTLEQMGRYWQIAREYAAVLGRIVAEGNELGALSAMRR